MFATLGFQHKPIHIFLLYSIGWVGSGKPSDPLGSSLFSEHVTLELLKALTETQPQLPHRVLESPDLRNVKWRASVGHILPRFTESDE